jgi:hypothetical protein
LIRPEALDHDLDLEQILLLARPACSLGLRLPRVATTAKAVGRAFNSALAESGGSIPIWLILNALKSKPRRTQLDLARAIGIEGPTLTATSTESSKPDSSSANAERPTAAPSKSNRLEQATPSTHAC